MAKPLHFYNKWHLGDHFLTLLLLRKLVEAGEDVTYYCSPVYHYELSFCCGGVIVEDLDRMPRRAIDTWLGRIFFDHPLRREDYVACQMDLYRLVCRDAKVPCPIRSKADLWFDWEEIQDNKIEAPDDKFFDVLIVNSVGKSSQCDSKPDDFNQLADKFASKGLRVACTEPIPKYFCGKHFGFTCLDLATLAMTCSYVVGVQTAPIHLTVNRFMKPDCKWGIIHKGTRFDMGNRVSTFSNLREVEKWTLS